MRFSYKVDGQFLIKSALFPVDTGKVYLVTGKENSGFGLIGGIIAQLFPINEKLDWPQLQALIENYTGELSIEEGELPQSTAYVGVDPNHHLFFSKVKEEMKVQTNNSNSKDLANNLLKFGLDASFLERRICSLSGGEKMKVSLAIAFSLNRSCYVLHGVIPWLDKRGREQLIKEITRVKAKGSYVILLEHEVYPLQHIVDKVFNFDGTTTKEVESIYFFSHSFIGSDVQKNAQVLSKQLNNPKAPHGAPTSHTSILEFEEVTLRNHPSSESLRTGPLLNEVSLKLNKQCIYALIGENGAGKSTIVQIAFRILKPDSGNVKFCGKSIQSFSREELINQICYIGQFPEQQISLSTMEQYKLKARQKNNFLSISLIERWLKLPDSFPVSLLSVFQMKLLLLTCSITNKTKLIILDEPTWGLDEEGQTIIFEILNDISKQLSFTLLIINHNLNLAHALKANILWLNEGRLSVFESITDLFSNMSAKSNFDIPVSLINGEAIE